MTILEININDTDGGQQRSFTVDTEDAFARLWGRYLVRAIPGSFGLAKHFYPDNVPVMERIGGDDVVLTITCCKDGVPNLILPTTIPCEWNHFALVDDETFSELYATESEKDRLFALCSDRIKAAASFLDPNSENIPTSVDDAQAKSDELGRRIQEAKFLTPVLGAEWCADMKEMLRGLHRDLDDKRIDSL